MTALPPAPEQPSELLPVPELRAFLMYPVTGTKGKYWPLTEEQVLRWMKTYPYLDIRFEARKALAWIEAHPTQKKTYGGMPGYLVRWFNRTTDRGGARALEPVSSAGKLTSRMASALENIQRDEPE